MASPCGRQECSIERRGFRHQLDSWRHRLLRCVGFESILEGLFGSELLKDLSLFKDFEPEGVSDWSFDENCLFCCLRREKVKEHLVSLDEPALEVEHQALLKQEQAKIIRFERQAEEFLHAVFYRKDSPRVSDPDIPLVAREIMQRMIRQFAAEYTSKTSSTQDSSSPNSTKNQSLLKASPVASSPAGATTQNPVLSKLLMADQDSPLDLTVRKSQLDPSEQDGVLDLSTKKSPCAGSTSLSLSPGCSTAPGNGENSADAVAIDSLGQQKSPLEKFMVRLCAYHQKHFVRVLNDICTEVQTGCEEQQLLEPENMDASTCSSGCSQYHTENQDIGNSCSESKLPLSFDPEQSGPHGSLRLLCHALKQAVDLKSTDRRENCSSVVRRDFPELPNIKASSASPRDSPTQGYLTASNSHHSAKSLEGQTPGSEQEIGSRKGEDDKEQMQSRALLGSYIAVKAANVNTSEDSLECRVSSQKNAFKAFPEEMRESAFTTSSPRRADKENALQCSSKAPLHQDTEINDQEMRQKVENHHQTSGKSKGSYHVHPVDKTRVENAKDAWLPTNSMPVVHHKATNGHPRSKNISASSKSTRKSKRSSGLRINDYDNQCDVVYISQPITECHFENRRIVSSRKTARKSTRGYYYNGECCELPTVRTLVKASQIQESGSTLAPRSEVLTSSCQGVTLSGCSYLATVQAITADGDKNSSTVTLFQEDPSIKISQETVESCPAESIPPLTSLLKQIYVGSTEASTVDLSLLPRLVPHKEGSLSVSSLQNTVVPSSLQLSEGEMHDKTDTDTVQQSASDTEPCKSSEPNENSDGAFNSDLFSVSEPVHSEESTPCLDKVITQESSICTDQEPPVTLMTSEEHEEKFDFLPPLEEPASPADLPPCMEPPPLSPIGPPLSSIESQTGPPTQLVSLEPSRASPRDLSTISEPVCSEENVANSRVASPVALLESVTHTIDPEPSETLPIESAMVLPDKVDSEIPQSLSDLDATEDPANLLCANAHENINTETNTEGSQGLEEGLEEENLTGKCEPVLPVSDTSDSWSEKTVKEACTISKPAEEGVVESSTASTFKISKMCNKEEASPQPNVDKKRKREKKLQVASDRCLRSQQSLLPEGDSTEQSSSSNSLQLPQLQIKLSKNPGTKRFKREVHLDGAASVCVPSDGIHKTLLNDITSTEKPPTGGESDITTGETHKTLLTIEEGQDEEGNKSKPGAMLEICLEASSDKRSVHVPIGTSDKRERETNLKPEVPENSESTMDTTKTLHTQCETSNPLCPGNRSGSKNATSEKAVKYKKPALQFYNLRHSPAPIHVATASKNMPEKETTQEKSDTVDIQSAGNEDTIDFSDVEMLSDNKPSFVDWCAEDENQELITNFNTQYMKTQKGWIQLEKEAQPAPKVKNKADKLKEIWKSKKRTRKFKGATEVQKLSPVQMLFMKAFDLSNICKWFMETTETKSLVIVKKMNTRLPGDMPPIKLPLQKGCSSYPSSLQAERLKKHLKKFAAMTPAKNTIKTQRLLAKLRENTEEIEEEQDASPKQTPSSEINLENEIQAKTAQSPVSAPVQTSSRILRKYSNLRGKLHGFHKTVKREKNDCVSKHPSNESKANSKSLSIKPLMSPKLAQQVKASSLPTKSNLAEKGKKVRKGKDRSQEVTLSKGNFQQSKKKALNESSKPQSSSSKESIPLKKGSKLKHVESPTTKRQPAMKKNSKLASQNEKTKKLIDLRPGKGKSTTQKAKVNSSQKVTPQSSRPEGPAKPLKQKVGQDSSSRSQKASTKKAAKGKTLTKPVKQTQENSKGQSKKKLRATKDSPPSKRRRMDAK
nr:ligand-dependent corepressor isoform X1 [Anolis sagrei ordinatus]